MRPGGLPIVTEAPGATFVASMTGIGTLTSSGQSDRGLIKTDVEPLRVVVFSRSLRWVEGFAAILTSIASRPPCPLKVVTVKVSSGAPSMRFNRPALLNVPMTPPSGPVWWR